jgi:acyl-coenzyme A synthetase/AMP-(fatty) acid ligase
MFGFETSVLAPLQTGNILCSARPFFPADVAATLAALPAPRVLVSTPIHLRALLDSQVAFPALERVVSSTAPLAPELARAAEHRLGCPLFEIYGSTETGQIASRRTSQSIQWQLSPQVQLVARDGGYWVEGGHVETPTQLSDRVEIVGARSFLLQGRSADLVNVAGKRSSLTYLNHQLTTIPGVIDGTFFHPDSGEAGATPAQVPRLAAVAVAPGCDPALIRRELRLRIDPVFLPRPLLLVARLPRDPTGKLPHAELQKLLVRNA